MTLDLDYHFCHLLPSQKQSGIFFKDLIKCDKNRFPPFTIDGLTTVTFTGNILKQNHIPNPKAPAFPIRNRKINSTFKDNHILPSRGIVPLVMVILLSFTKDYSAGRLQGGEQTDSAGILKFDLKLSKMGFTLLVCVDTADLHFVPTFLSTSYLIDIHI